LIAQVDAVSILAPAKAEVEEEIFEFLAQNLQQQGEFRNSELWLEMENFEIRCERNQAQ